MSSVTKLERAGIAGRIEGAFKPVVTITIKANGIPIAEANAVSLPGQEDLGFSRRVDDLWKYIGRGDFLEVECDGVRLPIEGVGERYIHAGDDKSQLNDLFRRIEKGYIFDKYGRVRLPISEKIEWQARVIRMFSEIREIMRAEFDYDLFVTYGTLLGCVRESNFIKHDNDIDVTYVSRHVDPQAVRSEFVRVCSRLMDHGFRGFITRHGFGIKRPVHLDIFFSYFSPRDEYKIAYGYHGPEVIGKDLYVDTVDAQLGSHTVRVPRRSEQLLEQLYGEGWRTPDPGFSHHTKTRKQDRKYLASAEELKPVFWKQFYLQNSFSDGSAFAKFVADRISSETLIVDVGCGQGRDSIFFGRGGFTVYGGDVSSAGLDQGRQLWRQAVDATGGEADRVTFEVVDVSSAASIRRFLAGKPMADALSAGRPVLIYMRFFIHAITDEEQAVLLETLFGDLERMTVAVEFRTDQDRDLPKFNAPHFRRYISGESFRNELVDRHGCAIEYHHEGHGLSPFQGEDPHLCRIIARRG